MSCLSAIQEAAKSTAIKAARGLIRQAGYTTFAPKKTSKEKYLEDLTRGGEEDEGTTSIEEFSVLGY